MPHYVQYIGILVAYHFYHSMKSEFMCSRDYLSIRYSGHWLMVLLPQLFRLNKNAFLAMKLKNTIFANILVFDENKTDDENAGFAV